VHVVSARTVATHSRTFANGLRDRVQTQRGAERSEAQIQQAHLDYRDRDQRFLAALYRAAKAEGLLA
jgi:hypothetical protein